MILNLIHKNDIKGLESLKIDKQDLNFLIEFKAVEIDKKISPLHLAAFGGK